MCVRLVECLYSVSLIFGRIYFADWIALAGVEFRLSIQEFACEHRHRVIDEKSFILWCDSSFLLVINLQCVTKRIEWKIIDISEDEKRNEWSVKIWSYISVNQFVFVHYRSCLRKLFRSWDGFVVSELLLLCEFFC